MAKTVTIRILSETPPEPNATASAESSSEPESSGKNGKKKQTKFDVFNHYVVKRAFNIIKAEAEFHFDRALNMSENYMMQANVSNAMQAIDMGHSLLLAGKMGADIFSKVGFSGVTGAAIGAAVAVATQVAGVVRKMETMAQSIAQNAYGNYFYGERAGYVAGGHGTEN